MKMWKFNIENFFKAMILVKLDFKKFLRKRSNIAVFSAVVSGALFFWFGFYCSETYQKPVNKVEIYEKEFEKELDSIYKLLAGMSVTQRVNMNLSLETNHYLRHEFSEDICPDCLKQYRYLIDNMPELPTAQQETFNMLYKDAVETAEKKLKE